jgi:hypothetical protein
MYNPFRNCNLTDRVGVTREMHRILLYAMNHPNVAWPLNNFLYNLRYQALPHVWDKGLRRQQGQQGRLDYEYDKNIYDHVERFDKQWKQFRST